MREWIFKNPVDRCSSFEHELETYEAADLKVSTRKREDILMKLDNIRFGDVVKFTELYCGEVTKITRCNYCKYIKLSNCIETIDGIESDEILLMER